MKQRWHRWRARRQGRGASEQRRVLAARPVFLSLIAGMIALLAVGGIAWYGHAMETMERWLQSQLRAEVQMVLAPVQALLRTGGGLQTPETRASVQSFLAHLRDQSRLVQDVGLQDHQGRWVAGTFSEPLDPTVRAQMRSWAQAIVFHWGDEGGWLPLRLSRDGSEGEPLTLVVRYDRDWLHDIRWNTALPIGIALGGGMILLLGFYGLMEWLGIRPLERVRRQLEEGAYVVSSDMLLKEFDYLVNALNQRMVMELVLRDNLEQQAKTDHLTRLYNRLGILRRLGEMIEMLRDRAGEAAIAVVFVDLDGFKRVNDVFGHDQGDKLLQKVSMVLRQFVASDEDIGRLGADQFLLLFKLKQGQVAAYLPALLSKLNQAVNVVFELPAGQATLLSASIGVSLWPRDGDGPEALMKAAEAAMYEAKSRGCNTAVLYDRQLDERVHREARIINDIRRAMEEGEFYLVFQPKIDMERRTIAGFEVLARWRHAELGELSPAEFIPLISRSVYQRRFARWMVEVALDFAREAAGEEGQAPSLAFNMQRLLLNEDFIREMIDACVRRSLSPSLLTLELLESDFFGDLKQRDHEVVALIKQHGVRLSIDDFGTGFSSLSYLQELEVDEIKVDRSFVSALETDQADEAHHLLQAIYGIASALALNTVVEGVENHAQLRTLYGMGFRVFQGFYFSRPLLHEQAVAFYRSDLPLEEKLRHFKQKFRVQPGAATARTAPRLRTRDSE